MIRKNLGATYEQGLKIAARKSAWTVFYLRARRSGDILKGFYRRQALAHRFKHPACGNNVDKPR